MQARDTVIRLPRIRSLDKILRISNICLRFTSSSSISFQNQTEINRLSTLIDSSNSEIVQLKQSLSRSSAENLDLTKSNNALQDQIISASQEAKNATAAYEKIIDQLNRELKAEQVGFECQCSCFQVLAMTVVWLFRLLAKAFGAKSLLFQRTLLLCIRCTKDCSLETSIWYLVSGSFGSVCLVSLSRPVSSQETQLSDTRHQLSEKITVIADLTADLSSSSETLVDKEVGEAFLGVIDVFSKTLYPETFRRADGSQTAIRRTHPFAGIPL